ncbi:MAG: polysaccharide biosynthesis tyrosine autokinase [Xenococcaceae cyanobacterium MO_188.B29]|nr:polysaccharide biosynthesis tyrosine autokinase [Xenococcaceae cyanobacterium MO_188.B29]
MQDTSPNRYIEQSNGNGKHGNAHYYSIPVLEQANLEEDEESLDLKHLLNVAKHRFRLIIALALGVTTLATLWTLNQKPIYEGNFQVLIEPINKQQKQNQLAFLGENLGGVDYDSQIAVLRSPSVLNPLITKLTARYPEIEYRDLIRAKNSPLEIEQLDTTKILDISYQDKDPDKVQFILENLAQAYLDYSLEEKRRAIEQGIEFVDDRLPELTKKVDEIQAELERFRQQHNLLDPQEYAVLVAEQLNLQEQKYFETQVQIKEAQSLYNNLQRQLGLEPQQALVTSYLSESPRYQDLLNQLQEINVSLAKESVRFLPTSPKIISLQEKRDKLLPLLEKEAAGILGRNLAAAIADASPLDSPSSLRLELSQQYIETANSIETLELRRSSLEGDITSLKQLTQQIPGIARQYSELLRELSIANESLSRFLKAQEELKIEIAQQSIPWQLIAQPTVGEDQIFPNPPRDIALGLIGGTLLGLAAALIAEKLDPVFHSPDEITEMIDLPLLGRVPIQKDLEPLEVEPEVKTSLPQLQIGNIALNVQSSSANSHHHVRRNNWYSSSPFLESFRSLNTNIRLLGSDSILNSIVVSSSIPSEGKSTISSHLAQAAAAMGQKVLLVDADLRRPQVHRWMGLPNTEGLSNILATNLDIKAAIKKIPQWENLSVISAGDIPPDPTRLLSSQKMQEFMEKIKNSHKYDLIIYDTPPILGFADGRILATRTNGVVLVVRMGKTDRSLLKQNIDNLRMSNVPVLGIVANQVNSSSSGSSYYTHYYTKSEKTSY